MKLNIFNLFTGRWVISRQLINYENDNLSATVAGVATFYQQHDATSLLHENVTVHWVNGTTSLATKSYLFEQSDDEILQYHFNTPINLAENGKIDQAILVEKALLHRLVFKKSPSRSIKYQSNSSHYCNKDLYKLSFKISSSNSFLTSYQISGPLKNCHVHSTYTKAINS